MLEWLTHIDQALFLLINVGLANPVTDFVMPIITSDHLLRLLFVLALVLILWRGDSRLRWAALASIVVIALTDQISSHLLKPWIGRLRPCHVLDGVNLLVGCGGGKSMPSSHAANAFGQAVLFGWLYRRVRWWLIGIAALIALSRTFVGVHYPGDILAGALIGVLIGGAVAIVFDRLVPGKTVSKLKEAGHAAAGS